jgi:2-polyprenyl-3-methyl-5-hydroxy-6-metoxy-1,4-benzoquinol methylase
MKFYDAYNAEYYSERITNKSKKHMMKYMKFVRKTAYLKMLDVGCGQGYYVRDAIEEGIDAYGIDISTHAFENALAEVKDRITFGSIIEIPFGDEEFDVMTAFDVIEHIQPKDTLNMVKEIRRVLKPGGIIIITTPNSNFGGWVFDLTHINVRPPRFWKLVFEQHNLQVKMFYLPSFLKYYIKNHIPLPDSIEFLVEEPFRYMLGRYYARKNARLYLVVKKPK